MSILNPKLLVPVREDAPCGEDLSDLTEYYVLEEHARGKEETQFSEAEPPDWPQVERLAQDLLLQGKEMWVISHLISALTVNHGISGLNEGINLLSKMLEAFWEDIFPETDFDDANPYEQRMNVLSSLSDTASPLMKNIRLMPICRSKQLGEFSFRDILISRGEIKAIQNETPPEKNLIEAAIRDTNPDYIEDMIRLLTDTIEHVRKIENYLNEAAGKHNNTSNILNLEDALKSILAFVDPWSGSPIPDDTPEEKDDDSGPGQPQEDLGGQTDNPNGQSLPASLNSRDDVYALLSEMIHWYEQNEPASPVAMILHRAKSLVGKNFFQIISSIMGPDIPQLQTLFGSSQGHPPPDDEPVIQQINFDIRSRHDILNWLDKVSMWYHTNEPSSPVPLFVNRAKELVGKNFQQIISEIADQAKNQVEDLLKNK